VHRTRQYLIASRHLHQLHAVLVEVVMLAQLFERHAHIGRAGIDLEGGQLLRGQRPACGEQRGLKELGERTHGQSPSEKREWVGAAGDFRV
jgi:hypothetical protein